MWCFYVFSNLFNATSYALLWLCMCVCVILLFQIIPKHCAEVLSGVSKHKKLWCAFYKECVCVLDKLCSAGYGAVNCKFNVNESAVPMKQGVLRQKCLNKAIYSSVTNFSWSDVVHVVSDSAPHGLQHTRLCPHHLPEFALRFMSIESRLNLFQISRKLILYFS